MQFSITKGEWALLYTKFDDGHTILKHSDYAHLDIQPSWFTPEFWPQEQRVGTASGRGSAQFLSTPGGNWVLRHYYRGGMAAKLSRDSFIYTGMLKTRAIAEFQLLEQMRTWQLPVPKPVAAHIQRVGVAGTTYRANIIIETIADSADLHNILSQRALTQQQWENVGVVIAQFHQHNVYHHDLNLRNILLDQHGQVWLIDFDKCGIKSGSTWQAHNISRLLRSFRKAQQTAFLHFSEDNWQALLNGYNSRKSVASDAKH